METIEKTKTRRQLLLELKIGQKIKIDGGRHSKDYTCYSSLIGSMNGVLGLRFKMEKDWDTEEFFVVRKK